MRSYTSEAEEGEKGTEATSILVLFPPFLLSQLSLTMKGERCGFDIVSYRARECRESGATSPRRGKGACSSPTYLWLFERHTCECRKGRGMLWDHPFNKAEKARQTMMVTPPDAKNAGHTSPWSSQRPSARPTSLFHYLIILGIT